MNLSRQNISTLFFISQTVFFFIVTYGVLQQELAAGPQKKESKAVTKNNKPAETKPDPALDSINKSWMAEIQREKTQTNESSPNTDSSNNSTNSENEKTTRLRNPGTTTAAEDNQLDGLFGRQEGPSFFSVLLRFVGLMALFVGGFYLFMRFVKKKGHSALLGGRSDLVDVLVSVPLVQGKFIQIVDIAGKLMILGVSEAGVQMLSEITDGLTADKIRLWQSHEHAAPPPATILDALTRTLKAGDFKFWQDRNLKSENSSKLDFKKLLDKESPTAGQSFTTTDNSTQSRQFPDQQTGTEDIDEITAMLQKHDRKLKSMSKKKPQ